MIVVTRINGDPIIVNAGLIEMIEATPDTVLSLVNGRKLMVRESIDEVIERATAYFRSIGQVPFVPTNNLPDDNDIE